jgi:hypothetical protein
VAAAAGAKFPGLEHLLDGSEEAAGVGEHDAVELLALGLGDVAALEGFEIEADGGDGGLEFVGDGVEEGVLALVAADLANEEDGVEHDTGDEQPEENEAEDDERESALVENDPGDVKDQRRAERDYAEGDEEGDGSASSVDVHGVELSIVCRGGLR